MYTKTHASGRKTFLRLIRTLNPEPLLRHTLVNYNCLIVSSIKGTSWMPTRTEGSYIMGSYLKQICLSRDYVLMVKEGVGGGSERRERE